MIEKYVTCPPNKCLTLVHGRLEIPTFNSTSFNRSYGLTVEVEFWHGNCSTFEILYNDDFERMYETNLITLGNFYTAQVDRLNITCAIRQSITPVSKKYHTFDLIIACLLSIVIYRRLVLSKRSRLSIEINN